MGAILGGLGIGDMLVGVGLGNVEGLVRMCWGGVEGMHTGLGLIVHREASGAGGGYIGGRGLGPGGGGAALGTASTLGPTLSSRWS